MGIISALSEMRKRNDADISLWMYAIPSGEAYRALKNDLKSQGLWKEFLYIYRENLGPEKMNPKEACRHALLRLGYTGERLQEIGVTV